MHNKTAAILAFATLALGAAACERSPQKGSETVSLNESTKQAMREFKARVAILVDEQGRTVAVNDQGKVLEACALKPEKPGVKVCRGLTEKPTITGIGSVLIAASKVNPTCVTVSDEYGRLREYCWEP